MIDDITKKKIIKYGLIIILGLFIAWCAYLLIPRSYIKFYTSPNQVVVLVDDNRHVIKSGYSMTIAPGKHTVVVFEDEFNPYEKEIEVKNGETYNFYAMLLPLTDKAREKQKGQNADDVGELFNNEQSTKITNIIDRRYPIVNIMPIQTKFYTLSLCKSEKYTYDPTAVAICADIYPPYYEPDADIKPLVIKDLRWREIDPDNQEIIWNVIKT